MGSRISINKRQSLGSPLNKAIALFLAVQMMIPSGASAQSASGLFALAPDLLSEKIQSNLMDRLGIQLDRSDAGKITEVFESSTPGPTLIHIQDAHGNLDAQRKTAQIISAIVKNHRDGNPKKLVFVEGTEGYIDTLPLKIFQKDAIDNTRSIFEKGMLSGAELAALQNPDLILIGVENAQTYRVNREAAIRAAQVEKSNSAALRELASETHDLLIQHAGRELKRCLDATDSLNSKNPDFRKVSNALQSFTRFSRNEQFTPDAHKPLSVIQLRLLHPNVYRWLQAEYLWNKFKIVKTPPAKAMASSDRPQAHSLASISATDRPIASGRTSRPEASSRQLSLSPQHLSLLPNQDSAFEDKTFSLSDLSHPIQAFTSNRGHAASEKFARVLQELNGAELDDELREIFQSLKNGFYPSPTVRDLDQLNELALLMQKLNHLDLSAAEYTKLRSIKTLDPKSIYQKLDSIRKRFGIKTPPLKKRSWNLDAALEYYQVAKKRDAVIAAKVVEALKALPEGEVAFLFTGGFHAQGIASALRSSDISYIQMMPSVSQVSDHDSLRYQRAMKWLTSTLALESALSVHPAAIVHEIAIPFITREFLESAHYETLEDAYEQVSQSLLAAYRQAAETQLRADLTRLGVPQIDAQISQRIQQFEQALADLKPVFQAMSQLKRTRNPSQKLAIPVKVDGMELVIKPYDERRPLTHRALKKQSLIQPIAANAVTSPGAAFLRDGKVFIDESLTGAARKRVIAHELRGHFVTASARRESPKLLRQLLDRLNGLPKAKKEALLREFYRIRIAPAESQAAAIDSSVKELAGRINASNSVMPEHPEIWQKAVTFDWLGSPVFHHYFLDELLAVYFELAASGHVFSDQVGKFIENNRQLMKTIGYFDSMENIQRRIVPASELLFYCYAISRWGAYSKEGALDASLLYELLGTGKPEDGEEKSKGIIAYNTDKFLEDLLDVIGKDKNNKSILERMKKGSKPRHQLNTAIAETFLNFLEQVDNIDSVTDAELLNSIAQVLENEGFGSSENISEMFQKNPQLIAGLLRMLKAIKEWRKKADKSRPDWRKKAIKKLSQYSDSGHSHRAPGTSETPAKKEEPAKKSATEKRSELRTEELSFQNAGVRNKWAFIRRILLSDFSWTESASSSNRLRLNAKGSSDGLELDLTKNILRFSGNETHGFYLETAESIFRGMTSVSMPILAIRGRNLQHQPATLLILQNGMQEMYVEGEKNTSFSDLQEMHNLTPAVMTPEDLWMNRREYVAFQRAFERTMREQVRDKGRTDSLTEIPYFKFQNGLMQYEDILGLEEGQIEQDIRAKANRLSSGTVNVLDIGAGAGQFLTDLRDRNIPNVRFYGQSLIRFDDLNLQLDIKEGDAIHLPFGDDSMDFIFMVFNTAHSAAPVELLQEISRVLKKNGVARITFDYPTNYRIRKSPSDENPLDLYGELMKVLPSPQETSRTGVTWTVTTPPFIISQSKPGNFIEYYHAKLRHPIITIKKERRMPGFNSI